MTKAARILLIDDSAVIRGLLARIIDAEPDLEVVGTASDGQVGLRRIEALKPDLVVLDIEMPIMDGLQTLEEIRKADRRLPVIMFSTLTERGAASTLRALGLGASDYATKPEGSANLSAGMAQVRDDLVTKIRALVGSRRGSPRSGSARNGSARIPAPSLRTPASVSSSRVDAVVLGCSTGGPVALETVIRSWTTPLPVPVFVVQHMPPVFTRTLAERINRKAATTVVEAEEGMVAEPGWSYVAPGGRHMVVRSRGDSTAVIALNDDPPENSCRPSVDPLFRSAIATYGDRLLAVMLTGMGNDGLASTGQIAELGCPVIAQDEQTSVVWGMPGAIVDAGHATEVLPIEAIGEHVQQVIASSSDLAGHRAGSRR